MVLGLGQLARGMLSLGAGRHAEAYAHLRRIDDPDDPAWSPRVRLDTLADHVEAAVLSGHRAEAVELMARLGPIARSRPATRCGPRATRSSRSAPATGLSARAVSCGPPARGALRAVPTRSTC